MRDITVKSKPCSNCKVTKIATMFHRSNRNISGLQSWCMQCNQKRTRPKRPSGYLRGFYFSPAGDIWISTA